MKIPIWPGITAMCLSIVTGIVAIILMGIAYREWEASGPATLTPPPTPGYQLVMLFGSVILFVLSIIAIIVVDVVNRKRVSHSGSTGGSPQLLAQVSV